MAIADNEEITATDLDNIAIDLGKSEFSAFSNAQKFGNDALNGITSALVGSGVLGVLNECKCTISGNTISVDTGVIVFADGSKIRLSTASALDIISGGKNYIYAKNDTTTGKTSLINSLTAPSGDYVPLAEYESGVLSDARVFALAKCVFTTNTNTIVKDVTIPAGVSSYTVDMGGRDVKLLIKKSSGFIGSNDIYATQGYNFSTESYINGCWLNDEYYFVVKSSALTTRLATMTKNSGDNSITFNMRGEDTPTVSFTLYAM